MGHNTNFTRNISDENDDQLNDWIKEQNRIASLVFIPPNSFDEDPFDLNQRYKKYKNSNQCSTVKMNNYYGGVDVGWKGNKGIAVYVILFKNNNSKMKIEYQSHECFETNIPYKSSFLAFREIEALEKLVKKQMIENPNITPCVILVDGNGIMHVRKAGIACFLGVKVGVPTIGVSKTLYCHDGLTKDLVKREVSNRIKFWISSFTANISTTDSDGDINDIALVLDKLPVNPKRIDMDETTEIKTCDSSKIIHFCDNNNVGLKHSFCLKLQGISNTVWGAAYIAKKTSNPIFISIGNNISLLDCILICSETSIYRIPEPIRMADLIGRQLLDEIMKE